MQSVRLSVGLDFVSMSLVCRIPMDLTATKLYWHLPVIAGVDGAASVPCCSLELLIEELLCNSPGAGIAADADQSTARKAEYEAMLVRQWSAVLSPAQAHATDTHQSIHSVSNNQTPSASSCSKVATLSAACHFS